VRRGGKLLALSGLTSLPPMAKVTYRCAVDEFRGGAAACSSRPTPSKADGMSHVFVSRFKMRVCRFRNGSPPPICSMTFAREAEIAGARPCSCLAPARPSNSTAARDRSGSLSRDQAGRNIATAISLTGMKSWWLAIRSPSWRPIFSGVSMGVPREQQFIVRKPASPHLRRRDQDFRRACSISCRGAKPRAARRGCKTPAWSGCGGHGSSRSGLGWRYLKTKPFGDVSACSRDRVSPAHVPGEVESGSPTRTCANTRIYGASPVLSDHLVIR